ncbi:MAG: DNA/RNA non-specific endonuclease [Acidobacteria bacterium]|nr:DNA/RNA non-specific endonuclease [Acidobacteriota bacterium]
MVPPQSVENAARRRLAKTQGQIRASLAAIASGNPLAAEWDRERLRERLQTKAMLSREEAEAVILGIRSFEAAERRKGKGPGPEAIWGSTIDFVGVSFLERGYRSARSVARIAFKDGRAQGTGFMVSDRLLLTNNHAVASPSAAADLVAEFEYELDPNDQARTATRFALDANMFFVTDDVDDLDYTVIALGRRLSGPRELGEFGWCALSKATDKHALGEVANIVQHPDGRHKEVVLRENRLVARLNSVIHYVADTEPGSSGSPVFNNEWKVIGLHHWGGPWRQKQDDRGKPLAREVNEAIRISAIVRELEEKARQLGDAQRSMLLRVLEIGERLEAFPAETVDKPAANRGGPRIEADGRVTWSLPLELSMRLPTAAESAGPATPSFVTTLAAGGEGAERKVEIDPDYDNRSGYKRNFITGFRIDPPRLAPQLEKAAARNLEAEAGDDPFELKYEHFSLAVNAERKLAFWTACNIDGKTLKSVNRKTGKIKPRQPGDVEALDAAEAREPWFPDRRLNDEDYTNDDLYVSQRVPGAKAGSKAHMDGMFQRGHLVRRADPSWGADAKALKADADTFHFTNCTPQVGFFNTGSAPDLPGLGGGKLWRAIEDYVLENAVDEQLRVCVFTGPVFRNNDPEWREDVIEGFQVPLRFWKIVVWSEAGALRCTAMIADQAPVLKKMPEALALGREAFADTTLVEDFVTTVEEIERLTRLDFGATVRGAQISGPEAARLAAAATGAPPPAAGRAPRKAPRRGARAARVAKTAKAARKG